MKLLKSVFPDAAYWQKPNLKLEASVAVEFKLTCQLARADKQVGQLLGMVWLPTLRTALMDARNRDQLFVTM